MQESPTLPGESQAKSDNQPGESQQPKQSQLDQVAALLRGDDPADNAGESQESEKPGESQKSATPKTINELAERLGVDIKDLYAVEFKMGETGESRTLGQLKDLAASQDQFAVDQLTFEETKTKREAEFLRAQAELQELIAMLPKNAIKPELLQAIAKKRATILEREQGLTLTAIPEWSDQDKETTDRNAMREHLAAYGYPANYLDAVSDHRTLKYIRDNMQRQQRIERALAQVKQVNKPGHNPSHKPSQPSTPPKSGRNPRTIATQVQKISELLRTG